MSFLPSAAGTQKQKIKRPQAFTLIELLVVIAIIAILMGLLFPAGQSALNAAKKTTAKNQAVQIATAITAYETEYGRLPPVSASSVDSGLVTILCTATSADNPRGLIFLEANAWKKGKGGSNSSGFCDPFGSNSVYQVKLDTNYANSLSLPTDGSGGSATMTKHVGVWTIWTNGTTKTLINSWE
jgi:prepilin-type N-terminal cleavage/methylation domain-containing protein